MSLSRSEVEESERIISEYLYSPTHFSAIRRSSLREGLIADKIKDKIHGNILDAVHIGNSYDSIGDIKVELEDGQLRYCELKMSENTGRGTAFNITVETLTNTDVFTKNVLSWKEYMEKNNHEDMVIKLLDSYDFYPSGIHDEYNTSRQKRMKLGRYIRKQINEHADSVEDALTHEKIPVQQAALIKQKITGFDREMKKDFLEYLSNHEINQKRLKALALVLAGGYHTKKQVYEYVDVVEDVSEDVGGIENVFNDYRVFYAHNVEDGQGLTVETGNQQQAIHELSNKTNWTFSFKTNDSEIERTSFEIGFIENDTQEFVSVYRISLNWKNVFQGIATPSVNGFKGEFFKNF